MRKSAVDRVVEKLNDMGFRSLEAVAWDIHPSVRRLLLEALTAAAERGTEVDHDVRD